jgi:hypothetical protein
MTFSDYGGLKLDVNNKEIKKKNSPCIQKLNLKTLLKRSILSQVPVAHACNPSYSGGRDQEDQGSKLAWAK